MVAVPRSTGCRICIKRRVKCDETYPFCKNCLKGRRPCPGYAFKRPFVDEGPRVRKRYSISAEVPIHKINSSPPVCDPVPQLPHEKHLAQLRARLRNQPKFPPELERSNPEHKKDDLDSQELSTAIPRTAASANLTPYAVIFSPKAYQEQLLPTLSDFFCPANQLHLSEAQRLQETFVDRLFPLSGTNALLDSATRAIALAHIGRANQVVHITEAARPFYGKALRLLNLALSNPTASLADETLAASILLSYYEMLSSEADVPWIRHAGGCGLLFKLRGPSRHRTGLGREMLLAYRHILIIEAMNLAQASFLDELEWRSIFQDIQEDLLATGVVSRNTDAYLQHERFRHEMARLPSLIEDIHDLSDDDKLQPSVTIKLKTRAMEWRSNIDRIMSDMEDTFSRINCTPVFEPSGDPVFPIAYRYVNVQIPGIYTTYWSVCIVMNVLLNELPQTPAQRHIFQEENERFATECCRSTFHMRSSLTTLVMYTMALRVSLLGFRAQQERDWVIRKLVELGSKFEMAKSMPILVGELQSRTRRESIETVISAPDCRKKLVGYDQNDESRAGLLSSFDEQILVNRTKAVTICG